MYSGNPYRPGTVRWLVPALAGWVAGTAVQLTQPQLWVVWLYGLCMLVGAGAAVGLFRRQTFSLPRGLCMLLAMALLAFGQVGLRALAFQARALEPSLEGRDLQITGVVASMPQSSASGLRMHLNVESAQADGLPVRLPPRIQLSWYVGYGSARHGASENSIPTLWAGERWRMVVRLKAPHGNSNPHSFDYELWLWEQGVQAVGYVRHGNGDAAPQRLAQTWRHPVELARQEMRQRIEAQLPASDHAGWISALVTGDQNAIARADWDVFRATGVAHLMSISGLHITMFAWLAGRLTGVAWRRSARLCLYAPAPHAAVVGGLALACAYAVFSGWGVPSRRTIWMLAVFCLLRLSGRAWPWPVVWLLAGVVVLLMDPWAWLQAGFWLSFVAVGVLFATDDRGEHAGTASVWSRTRAMLREQWLITMALSPLVLLLFGQVSVVGFAANLFAIPWVTLLVTPLAMAGALVAPAWDLAEVAIGVLAGYLRWLAQLPFATLSVASVPGWVGLGGVVGGFLLAVRLPVPFRLGGVALLVPVLLWQPPRPPVGQFDLLAADIGQGNAVLVRTAHHALLFDAGPRFGRDSDAGDRVLVPLMRALDVQLDLLVLSHRDTDHVGGAASVLAAHGNAQLLGSLAAGHDLWRQRPGARCTAGQRWVWDGVVFTVLHPSAQSRFALAKPNAMSCVLRVSASGGSGRHNAAALLTGDIEAAQERQLLKDGVLLQVDVLVVPHHGSKTSSSAAFLDAVAPRVALVQSGYRNRFGHPADVPMARYARRRIAVFDSPHCGAMFWRSARPGEVICQRLDELRYWKHRLPDK
jgi:competence protein ComEC